MDPSPSPLPFLSYLIIEDGVPDSECLLPLHVCRTNVCMWHGTGIPSAPSYKQSQIESSVQDSGDEERPESIYVASPSSPAVWHESMSAFSFPGSLPGLCYISFVEVFRHSLRHHVDDDGIWIRTKANISFGLSTGKTKHPLNQLLIISIHPLTEDYQVGFVYCPMAMHQSSRVQ